MITHPFPATPVREEVHPSSPHTAILTGMRLEGSSGGKFGGGRRPAGILEIQSLRGRIRADRDGWSVRV